ncbi:MAG: PAS domain-containing sensor histidine kinase [Candidatus Omnitrophota bacterium]
MTVVLLKDEQGEPYALGAFAQDITEQKKAEESLRKSEARFRGIFESGMIGILFWDGNGDIIEANDAFLKIVGYSKTDIFAGKVNLRDITPREYRSLNDKALREIAANGTIAPFEKEYICKDGSRVPVLIGAALQEASKRGGVAFVLDIAELKTAREKLLWEIHKSKMYLDIADVILIVIDEKGRVSLINKKGCQVLGYKYGDIIGKDWFSNFLPKKIAKKVKSVFKQVINGDTRIAKYYENTILTKKGKEKIIAWHNTPLKDEAGNVIGTLSSGEDITGRKKALKELSESEERYRALFEGAPDGIIIADVKNGQYIQVNSSLCKKLGYSEKEIKEISRFKSIHPKEDVDRIKDLFHRQASGEIDLARDIPFVKKNGSLLYFDVSSVLLEIAGKKCVTALLRDVTDRTRAERTKKHLMRDVSHGLKTPIAISQMALYVYKDGIKRGDIQEALEAYDIIANNLNILRKDIDNILMSTTIDMRKDESKRKKGKCSLKRIVAAIIKDTRSVLTKENIKTRINISSEANRVAIHERDAKILLNCLMDNAAKFTKKGSISISSRKNKNKVELKVKDTGCGMTKQQIEMAFEKFYKRHPAVEGSGLGLSICKDIVEMYNGEIEVRSEGVKKGTTVVVRLPKG